MFSEQTVFCFYVFQMTCLCAVWIPVTLYSLTEFKTIQHEDWTKKGIQWFALYCLFEFIRIVDAFYTDLDTGHIYSVWGVVPQGPRMLAWVLRDVVLFRAIFGYFEYALTWTHVCLDMKVPRSLLTVQNCTMYLGNLVFLFGAMMYVLRNDQFWQPVCGLGFLIPNIVMVVVCYYLKDCLKRVPDCGARMMAQLMSTSCLCVNSILVMVFPIWCTFRMMELYGRPLPGVSTVPHGSSAFFVAPPSFVGTGLSLDLLMETVELSIGCGYCIGLILRPRHVPGPGEPLVLTAVEFGKAMMQDAGKKTT